MYESRIVEAREARERSLPWARVTLRDLEELDWYIASVVGLGA